MKYLANLSANLKGQSLAFWAYTVTYAFTTVLVVWGLAMLLHFANKQGTYIEQVYEHEQVSSDLTN